MKSGIFKIVVEKFNVSDDFYQIVEVKYKNGDWVDSGQIICDLENSKTVYEIETPIEGYFYTIHSDGDEIECGVTLAVISDVLISEPGVVIKYFNIKEKEAYDDKKFDKIRLSDLAKKLIIENEIDLNVFVNKQIITKKDVENYLASVKINNDTLSTEIHLDNLNIDNKSIVIIGGGGHAKVCIEILELTGNYNIIGIIDKNVKPGKLINQYKVLGNDQILPELFKLGCRLAVNGIGSVSDIKFRKVFHEKIINLGYDIPNIIHPKAIIEKSVRLGTGNQIFAGAIISSNVEIGENNIINSGAIISHDVKVKNNSHLAPGCILAGSVEIGNQVLIGMGSTIYLGCKIGSNVVIKNGANIYTDISDNELVK